jgi:hypothetical protein
MIEDQGATGREITCLAERRVEVSITPKGVNALFGALDRFKSGMN